MAWHGQLDLTREVSDYLHYRHYTLYILLVVRASHLPLDVHRQFQLNLKGSFLCDQSCLHTRRVLDLPWPLVLDLSLSPPWLRS